MGAAERPAQAWVRVQVQVGVPLVVLLHAELVVEGDPGLVSWMMTSVGSQSFTEA